MHVGDPRRGAGSWLRLEPGSAQAVTGIGLKSESVLTVVIVELGRMAQFRIALGMVVCEDQAQVSCDGEPWSG